MIFLQFIAYNSKKFKWPFKNSKQVAAMLDSKAFNYRWDDWWV